MDWFRWHHGSVTDPKFQVVAKRAGTSVAEVLGVWACVLEAASANDMDRGNVGNVDFDAIDCLLGLPDGKAEAIYRAMGERSLLDPATGRVGAWDRRQPKRERDDSSTERSRAFRERQRLKQQDAATDGDATPSNAKEIQGNTNATPCNAAQRSETPRLEKRREEDPPYSPPASPGDSGADAPTLSGEPAAQQPKPRAKRESKPLKTLRTFRADGGLLVRVGDDPLLAYADSINLPDEFLRIAAHAFDARFLPTEQKQRDWPAHFRNAVQCNWFRLWWDDAGTWRLTTAGKQAERELQALAEQQRGAA